jgi:predicted ATPase/DNA-binding SARP family transcriptional activator
MAELLEITTLGGLRIRQGDMPVTGFRSRKAEALLVYLACNRHTQPREVLADLFWDERSTAQTLTNLRWLLAELGKRLSPYLDVTRSSVRFKPDAPSWLDVAEFESHLDTARRARTRGDKLGPAAKGDLEAAVSLYGGPFLQGFYLRDGSGFEDWMLGEQDRLQRLAAAALHDLTTYYLERGEQPAGIGHAVRLLQIDPLHEETHRQLMMLLVRSGQRRAALEQYETCRRILASELGAVPTAATTELYEQIREGAIAGTGGRVSGAEELILRASGTPLDSRYLTSDRMRPHNLPQSLTPFIGRETELAELASFLANPDCRLVTLVGPGGSGKTRLAIEAAQAIIDEGSPGAHHQSAPTKGVMQGTDDGQETGQQFEEGIYLVQLTQVSEASFLAGAIADTLQVKFSGTGDPESQLLSYLAEKRMLLVMDNFEHLLSGVELLPRLLQAAPGVKLLVTSREPLHLSAEQLFDVAGLPVPPMDELEGASGYDAVKLFVQRARRMQARFALTEQVAPWVTRICRAVEGLPLAIELSAVWVRDRSCQEIAEELTHNLDLLATNQHDVPSRHRSLRAVFDQSWRLLSEMEGQVLRQASIFRGGFDLEAANKVLDADRVLLSGLVQQFLLRQSTSGRYEMHELLRQYAAEKLNGAGEESAEVAGRHTEYYVALAEEADVELIGPRQIEWSSRIEREHDNVRAVIARSLEGHDVETALRLSAVQFRFWYFRSYFTEGRRWCDAALALAAVEPATAETEFLRAKVLNTAGVFAREQGEYRRGMALVQECVDLLRALGKWHLTAGALNNLGINARDLGDYEQAESYFKEAEQIYRKRAESEGAAALQGVALALGGQGKVALWRGDLARARISVEESLAIAHEIGDKRSIALQLTSLGQIALEAGDYVQAQGYFADGLALYEQVSDQRGLTDCLEGLAIADSGLTLGTGFASGKGMRQANENKSGMQQGLDRPATLYGAACTLRGNTGARISDADSRRLERMVVSVREVLGEEGWSAALARGRAMTPEEASAYALEGKIT